MLGGNLLQCRARADELHSTAPLSQCPTKVLQVGVVQDHTAVPCFLWGWCPTAPLAAAPAAGLQPQLAKCLRACVRAFACS